MFAHKAAEITHPIVVRPEELKFLYRFVTENFTDVAHKVALEDGTAWTPDSIDEVLSYENPDFRRIRTIEIKGECKDPKTFVRRTVELILGTPQLPSDKTGRFVITVNALDDLNMLDREIAGRIRQMRPWYYWLYRVDFVGLLLGSLVALWVALMLYSFFRWAWGARSAPSNQPMDDAEATGSVIVFLMILVITGISLNRTRDFLLPKVAFCIGRQKQWYERRMKLGHFIFGVVLLGIVLNLIGNWIS